MTGSFYVVSSAGRTTVRQELGRILGASTFSPYSATPKAVAELEEAAARADELGALGDVHGYEARIADLPATEPTEQGLQFVIPGCERRDDGRGPAQGRLF